MQNRKNKRAKACDIPARVKREVWERDKGRCVLCGASVNTAPNAHYISRAHGGLGIPENIVTLCTGFGPGNCHDRYDNGTKEERVGMRQRIREYLKSQYPGWEESRLIYKKGDSDGSSACGRYDPDDDI